MLAEEAHERVAARPLERDLVVVGRRRADETLHVDRRAGGDPPDRPLAATPQGPADFLALAFGRTGNAAVKWYAAPWLATRITPLRGRVAEPRNPKSTMRIVASGAGAAAPFGVPVVARGVNAKVSPTWEIST